MRDTYYYPAHITGIPAGRNLRFVLNHNTKEVHILPKTQLHMLGSLSGCRTIDEFFRIVEARAGYELSENLILKRIEEWVHLGLLRPMELLTQEAASSAEAGDKVNERKVQIAPEGNTADKHLYTSLPSLISGTVTRGRPEILKKWLYGRVDSPYYRKERIPIFISDDSVDRESRRKNRKTAETFRSNYPGEIVYRDLCDREQWIDTMAQSLPQELQKKIPKDLLRFALTGTAEEIRENVKERLGTWGANRNTMLLAAAGSYYYSSDDDLYYRFYRHKDSPSPGDAVGNCIFSDSPNPIYRGFPDMEKTTEGTELLEDSDPIEKALHFLRSGIDELVTRADLSRLSPAMARKIEKGTAKVRAVNIGYYGGRWYTSPLTFLMNIEETDPRFLSDPENYSKLKYNGLNIFACRRTTLTSSDFLQGGTLILDNTELLPPYFPLGRHEDTVFGILLHRLFENAFFVHLPFAAYHDPEHKTPFPDEHLSDMSPGLGKMVELLLYRLTIVFRSTSPAERMRELGKKLQDLGSTSLPDFEEEIKAVEDHYFTLVRKNTNNLLTYYSDEEPWYERWAADVRRCNEAIELEQKNPLKAIPRELRNTNGTSTNDNGGLNQGKEEVLSVFQEWLYRYGLLLEHWPEIWEAARRENIKPETY